jgi:hypothetical protein
MSDNRERPELAWSVGKEEAIWAEAEGKNEISLLQSDIQAYKQKAISDYLQRQELKQQLEECRRRLRVHEGPRDEYSVSLVLYRLGMQRVLEDLVELCDGSEEYEKRLRDDLAVALSNYLERHKGEEE